MAILPDYLREQTEDGIRKRMLERVSPNLDKSEGSYIWDAISPTSAELAQAAIWAQEVLRRAFASTTFGPYLELRAEERGVYKKDAVHSKGAVTFTGTAGTSVPSGTIVVTEADPVTGTSSIEFVTISEVTLGESGTGNVEIKAVVAGKLGNVPAGAIRLLAVPVTGVTGMSNSEATFGGADMEDDESLLQRFLSFSRQPAASGNLQHYRQWALEVPGIGDAKVFPQWNGPLTVKVAVVDVERQPVDAPLVASVAEYIEQVRPIGAEVTVVSAQSKAIDAAATVVLAAGYSLQDVSEAFAAAAAAFFRETAFVVPYVSHARLGTLLLSIPGILDYDGLTLNGGTANVALNEDEVPVLGTVDLEV